MPSSGAADPALAASVGAVGAALPTGASIGLIADDPLTRRRVIGALGNAYRIHACETAGVVGPARDVVGWLVFLPSDHTETASSPALEHVLEGDVPVWFTDESVPAPGTASYRRWLERLRAKLAEALASSPRPGVRPAPDIWVLGASLGGPDAIKRFLDALPADVPVGFVYVQHSETRTLEVLARVLGRHSEWRLRLARPGQALVAGDVVLVQGDAPVLMGPNGNMCSAPVAAPGRYSPDITGFLRGSAAELSGLILFSGMGDDGHEMVPELSRRGVPVWAQTPASCASAAMVEAACKTGAVDVLDEPEGLARRLAARYLADSGAPTGSALDDTKRRACPMN